MPSSEPPSARRWPRRSSRSWSEPQDSQPSPSCSGVPLPLARAWAETTPWQWTGGLIGAVYVLAAVVLAPKLGAGTLVAAVVAGQMFTSLMLDQYGLIGFPVHSLSPVRLLGAVLVIAGVILIQRP